MVFCMARREVRVYRSMVDWWLAVLTIGGLGLGLIVVAVAAWSEGDPLSLGIFLSVLVMVGILAWPVTYTLTEDELVVRSGVLRWRVRFTEVEGVVATRAMWSSPAWSLDRLRVDYGKGRWILISPERREEFVRELKGRAGLG